MLKKLDVLRSKILRLFTITYGSSFFGHPLFYIPFFTMIWLVVVAMFRSIELAEPIERPFKDLVDMHKYYFFVHELSWRIIAAFVPILGLCAVQHRSIQTSLQMELTKEQNTFANYYKHREEFCKHLKDSGWDRHGISPSTFATLHRFCFPESDKGIYTYSQHAIDMVNTEIRSILSVINTRYEKSETDTNVVGRLKDFFEELGVEQQEFNRAVVSFRDIQTKDAVTTKEYLHGASRLIEDLFSFSYASNPPSFDLDKLVIHYQAYLGERSRSQKEVY